MVVPIKYANRYVYHFSHLDNLPGLLQNGFLANTNPMFPRRHRSIAAAGIQQRRANMVVPCGMGGYVHDYVPFYFGSCSPMLLSVINAKNIDQLEILYFEFPISLVDRPDAVFTSASANTTDPPQFYSDSAQLDQLDWEAIDSLKWSNPSDEFRHRRMAELLVHRHLPVTDAARCVVWNSSVQKRVEQVVNGAPFPPIELENPCRRHWFKDFANNKRSSLVCGPKEIAGKYAAACRQFADHSGKHAATATFGNLEALLAGLRANFGCLPHTTELVGLKSANGVHNHTVDVHSKDVVQRLLELPEYGRLGDQAKQLVEIAAYLHDIGKGPQSRWANNGGVQKVDPNHPVGAMPMMVEILTKHVGSVEQPSAESLMKLVCYHDLVGDVLGKGRDEQQIIDVIDDEEELQMIFALGKADAESLVEHWWNQDKADQLYERCLEAI